jgi:hypothetical protein
VIEHVSRDLIHAVVWNKCALTIARQSIRWNGQNMRWETSPLDVSRGAGMIGVPVPLHVAGRPLGREKYVRAATLLFRSLVRTRHGRPFSPSRSRHHQVRRLPGGRGPVGAKPFEGGTRRRVRRRGSCGASPVCAGGAEIIGQ